MTKKELKELVKGLVERARARVETQNLLAEHSRIDAKLERMTATELAQHMLENDTIFISEETAGLYMRVSDYFDILQMEQGTEEELTRRKKLEVLKPIAEKWLLQRKGQARKQNG